MGEATDRPDSPNVLAKWGACLTGELLARPGTCVGLSVAKPNLMVDPLERVAREEVDVGLPRSMYDERTGSPPDRTEVDLERWRRAQAAYAV